MPVDREPFSDALEQCTRPKAPSTAHRDQPVVALRPLELVGGFGDEKTPGRAEWMTQRNGPAVGIDTRHVGPDLLGPSQHDRGKGLVDFHDVDVVDREPRALEQSARGWDRPLAMARAARSWDSSPRASVSIREMPYFSAMRSAPSNWLVNS